MKRFFICVLSLSTVLIIFIQPFAQIPYACITRTSTYRNANKISDTQPGRVYRGYPHPKDNRWLRIDTEYGICDVEARHFINAHTQLTIYRKRIENSSDESIINELATRYRSLYSLSEAVMGTPQQTISSSLSNFDSFVFRKINPAAAAQQDIRLRSLETQTSLAVQKAEEAARIAEYAAHTASKAKDALSIRQSIDRIGISQSITAVEPNTSNDVNIYFQEMDNAILNSEDELSYDPDRGFIKKTKTGAVTPDNRLNDIDDLGFILFNQTSNTAAITKAEIIGGNWEWHHLKTKWKSAARFNNEHLTLMKNGYRYRYSIVNGIDLTLWEFKTNGTSAGRLVFNMKYNEIGKTFSGKHLLDGQYRGHEVILRKID